VVPGVAVAAEGAAWVAAMASIPEENVNLTDTVAVTNRKCFFFFTRGKIDLFHRVLSRLWSAF